MIEIELREAAEKGTVSFTLRVVAIALNGTSKSKHIVRWATDKFINEGNVAFKLLHVFHKISGVPTPMGNLISLSQLPDDDAAVYNKEIKWQRSEMILPYQKLISSRKVPVETVLIESDEIWNAILVEIAKEGIQDLVIGGSTNSLFGRSPNHMKMALCRKIRGQLLSSVISECAPSFCTVYVVSEGRLKALRLSDPEAHRSAVKYESSMCKSAYSSTRYTSSTLDPNSTFLESRYAFPLIGPAKHLDSSSSMNYRSNNQGKDSTECNSFKSANTRGTDHTLSSGFKTCVSLMSINEDNESWITDQGSSSKPWPVSDEASTSISPLASSSEGQEEINLDLEKLRIELRHVLGRYQFTQNETEDATRQLGDLTWLRLIKEKEQKAKRLSRQEKQRFEAEKREVEHAKHCAKREAFQREEAELKAARDAKEKEKLKNVLAFPYQYQAFTWEEISYATYSFNKELKIGEGSYGTVYKCQLHHTSVAIKVLHSKEGAKSKQLFQELEILSEIRHPHLLLLLGACPGQGCLVYEYMQNGSLEDHLFHKNNTPPIPWYERFRIVWEVASALAFLHNNKTKAIIHCDLKPANILLDHKFVSKIGDAGLSNMLDVAPFIMSTKTMYKDTSPVGTLCYRDPEYQRTGQLSFKADVYALGIVILQLLTAKSAVGITRIVECSIKEHRLMQILDTKAGRWPIKETAEMALLGLECAELRGRDRPGLQDKVLPMLERMKDVAEKARDMAAGIQIAPPSHFICPILKVVMDDPCVASDGYTYDRKAIELWLKDNDTSPTTDFELSNKHLIPNYSLLYAITEWKSKRNAN